MTVGNFDYMFSRMTEMDLLELKKELLTKIASRSARRRVLGCAMKWNINYVSNKIILRHHIQY